ncbi:solute carrier family 66 member 2 [Caerostris extrusa]|uniref:Solute carrier family 66 member 2 n=1 Tax=Caerostris extrusa TaxID=172846 RepID=A0AAV4R7E6_CAEEX|nr:solute carrier family 66 member 2 [Caerostris extrusa]
MSTEWYWNSSDFWETLHFQDIVTWFCAGAMIFGGVVPYIPQYREIQKTDNADGFSTYVCLVLLLANTLRIIFCIIMITTMLAMMNLCIGVRNKTAIVPSKSRLFSAIEDEEILQVKHSHSSITRSYWDFEVKYFWEWTDFLSYLEFLATFTAIMGIFMYFCIETFFVVETIGFLAVFIEAMLGAPQFYRNLRKKSTLGMSKKMVCLWTLGDVFKTAYYILREAPIQFWLCGILQVAIDLSILLQVLIYRITPSPVKLLLKGESHTS